MMMNLELNALFRQTSMVLAIQIGRLCWLAHVHRVDDSEELHTDRHDEDGHVTDGEITFSMNFQNLNARYWKSLAKPIAEGQVRT